MEFIPTEKAVPIRYPSTANLMIDSQDGNIGGNLAQSMSNFSINRPNALLNGYFTRIGVTELVLNWNEPNISAALANDIFRVIKTSGAVTYSITLPDGSYTIAQALDQIVVLLNAAGTGLTWSVSGIGANCSLNATGAYTIPHTSLSLELGFGDELTSTRYHSPYGPNLSPIKYLDFVSYQLTNNQTVKDSSTTSYQNTVLARWYFAWDTQPVLDPYGFPILMGYTPFSTRRTFNPPKQIRWLPNQSIGNLSFQVYANGRSTVYQQDVLLSQLSNWLMTLQVSEV